ncbi:hypothetical protein AC1031_003594 [Aphanomyces cochlioides]|nr:hypothetical protein AC1031_003594 [Aphanomyces cochlioides]
MRFFLHLVASCAAAEFLSRGSFGSLYNPHGTEDGLLCKSIEVMQQDLTKHYHDVPVRLNSMTAPCMGHVLAAASNVGARVWLGLRETNPADETELESLKQIIATGSVPADLVAGIHVSNEGIKDHKQGSVYELAQYVERVKTFLRQSRLGHVPVVISDVGSHTTHVIHHQASTANSSTAPSTEPPIEFPNETTTETQTEAPTDAPTEVPTEAPTETPTEAPTQAPAQEDAESNDSTAPPATTSYFGADCPETQVQKGDASRAILARVCGYKGSCKKDSTPTIWTLEQVQCPSLLLVGSTVRVCCA